MTEHELLKPLYELLSEVDALIQFANDADWDSLAIESTKYQQHVMFLNDIAFINALNEAGIAEEAKALIAKVQFAHDLLDVQATTERDRIASELRQVIQANKALDAYGR